MEVICKRCKSSNVSVLSRKEHFCDDCFIKFVTLKQRKQMMSDEYYQNIFKISYQDKKRSKERAEAENASSKVLLPLSLGSSSLVTLDVVSEMLREQKVVHRNKTGFSVTVVTVCNIEEREEIMTRIRSLKERFHDIKDAVTFCIIDIDQFFNTNLSTMIFDARKYETRAIDFNGSFTIKDLQTQTGNKTSAEDLKNLIVPHLIKTFAAKNKFKTIIWGHSMTRLADEIISLVVKGRASEIANSLDDSNLDEDYNNVFKNLHPLRDVLLSEIDAYCYIKKLSEFCYNYQIKNTILLEKDTEECRKPTILVKNSTINNIARQYFDSIEESYANVISTVVRTGAKLANPTQNLPEQYRCSICNNIIYTDPKIWAKNITVNDAYPISTTEEIKNFENWKKLQNNEMENTKSMQKNTWDTGITTNVCYGCLVTLSEARNNDLTWANRETSNLSASIKEYILTDDEEDSDLE